MQMGVDGDAAVGLAVGGPVGLVDGAAVEGAKLGWPLSIVGFPVGLVVGQLVGN